MSNAKNISIISIALLLAFVLGYKRDLLSNTISETQKKVTKAAEDLKPATSDNVESSPSLPVAKQEPQPQAPRKIPSGVVIDQRSTPHNPYAEMMKAAAEARKKHSESMSGTLDSIRGGEIGEARKVQRNAYFDKLSQQLKELRGENPPPNKPQAQVDEIEAPKRGAARPKSQPAPQGVVIPQAEPDNVALDDQLGGEADEQMIDELADDPVLDPLDEDPLLNPDLLEDEVYEDPDLLLE